MEDDRDRVEKNGRRREERELRLRKEIKAEEELTKTRKQLKDLEEKATTVEKNSKIVTQTENNSNLPKFAICTALH